MTDGTDIDQRTAFQEWFRTTEYFMPGAFDRRISDPSIYANGNARLAWEAWLASASRPITEEMVIRGAWGPINEALKARGIAPFDSGAKPSKPEIERARLILCAALGGASHDKGGTDETV